MYMCIYHHDNISDHPLVSTMERKLTFHVSCILDKSQTCYISENDVELQFYLPPPSACQTLLFPHIYNAIYYAESKTIVT